LKIAILSDIHGNYDAFEAVLEDIDNQGGISKIYCLGDVIGYGAQPNECTEKVIELGCETVAGNHDFASVGKLSFEFFNTFAKQSALWTKSTLSKENNEWIQKLNYHKEVDNLTLVHGTPFSPEMFHYISTLNDAQVSFEEMKTDICFVGHSHVPIVFFNTNPISYVVKEEIKVATDEKTIVNVGSVGQPRDENPKACYAIYDTDEAVIRLVRVKYDVDAAAQKIIKEGLPEILAARLKEGR
jgi:diadenosine tetraphosphatase ApaH/serine/threonine PP2A family protein phosphatase